MFTRVEDKFGIFFRQDGEGDKEMNFEYRNFLSNCFFQREIYEDSLFHFINLSRMNLDFSSADVFSNKRGFKLRCQCLSNKFKFLCLLVLKLRAK